MNCRNKMIREGKDAIPKSCPDCKFGPCAHNVPPKITASDMIESSGPSASEHREYIDSALDRHRISGDKTKRQIILRDRPYCDWLYKPEAMNDAAKQCIDSLKADGFTVSMHYVESQFVDYGLKVEW